MGHHWSEEEAPLDLLIYKLRTMQNKVRLSPALSSALDTKEVRAWLDHCDDFHTDHCGQSAQSKQVFNYLPKWLIDVGQLCLVPATTRQCYVALS